jgi:TRAP-type C4-dicarboxylate transport system substrate-binding protein
MRKLWDARVAGARQRLLAEGVKENEVTDRAAFVALRKPVYDQFVTTPTQKRLVADIEAMA